MNVESFQTMDYNNALIKETARIRHVSEWMQVTDLAANSVARHTLRFPKDKQEQGGIESKSLIRSASKFLGRKQWTVDCRWIDHPQSILLRPLIESVFRQQQRLANARNITLRLDLHAESIVWFPVRFLQLMDSLLHYAFIHRDPEKGESRVGVSVQVRGPFYEVRISDNGRGLGESQIQAIGKLFATRVSKQSQGLLSGIALSKSIAEACSGTISMCTERGKGTSVAVLLPSFVLENSSSIRYHRKSNSPRIVSRDSPRTL
jgi:signal transduction histidine kinase